MSYAPWDDFPEEGGDEMLPIRRPWWEGWAPAVFIAILVVCFVYTALALGNATEEIRRLNGDVYVWKSVAEFDRELSKLLNEKIDIEREHNAALHEQIEELEARPPTVVSRCAEKRTPIFVPDFHHEIRQGAVIQAPAAVWETLQIGDGPRSKQ